MTDHFSLALATLAFVGLHFVLSHPLRVPMVQNMGELGFRILYSLLAFLALGWMILAYNGVNSSIPLWVAPDSWWDIASLVTLLASILLAGSVTRNPALPHPKSEEYMSQPARGVFAITRHPMNWSFMLWALAHISVWGSPRNLIVAGGIFILALFGSIGQDRKKVSILGRKWLDWQEKTSFVPFGAVLKRKAKLRDAAPGWPALIGGLLLWLVVTAFHAPASSPLGWLGLR